MTAKTKKFFSLNDEFERYLKLVKLDKRRMPPVQLREIRRAFYGACGQMLILARDGVAAIENEDEAAEALQDMLNQVANFWNEQSSRQN